MNTFYHVPVNYLNGPLVNITYSNNANQTYFNVINYTAQANSKGSIYKYFSLPLTNNKIVLFTTSLYFYSNNQVSLCTYVIQGTPLSIDTYRIDALLGIHANIYEIFFSMIVFDYNDIVKNAKDYALICNRLEFNSTGGVYPLPAEFVDQFMIGLT